MNIEFTSEAWDQLQYWIRTDRRMVKRIDRLLNDCRRHPYDGIGKPEPLKEEYSGYWSRRIDEEHRLIYRVVGGENGGRLEVVSCRFHYV